MSGPKSIIDVGKRPLSAVHLFQLVIASVIGAIIGGALVAYWGVNETYTECVLREMRGKPEIMHYSVEAICRERHPQK